ncbi:MAG: hypothetical protein AAGM67_03905 [Bacteroidota bacterium]
MRTQQFVVPLDMDFSSGDIRLLYGERFFLIEDDLIEESVPPKEETTPEKAASPEPESKLKVEAVAVTPTPLQSPPPLPLEKLQSGAKVSWKMRPTAEFVTVLRQSEFGNKTLTGMLKSMIVEAGIDPAKVGFGVIPDDAQSVDLTNCEKSLILLFDRLGTDWPAKLEVANKQVWPLPKLALCQSDQQMAQAAFAHIQSQLS